MSIATLMTVNIPHMHTIMIVRFDEYEEQKKTSLSQTTIDHSKTHWSSILQRTQRQNINGQTFRHIQKVMT